jgi:protein-disulfide isomerase
MLSRRSLLAAAGGLVAIPLLARAADDRMAPRADGSPSARNVVEEWFSFTCPHCADFALNDYPEIKAKLVDTGRVRFVFREYPRDKTDLAAALVARSLPASRYEPFVMALFANQKHWAYDPAVDPTEELAKMAGLAGLPRDAFDRALADDALKTALLQAQTEAEQKYNIDSTPTFIINGKPHAGELTYAQFAALLS